MEPSLPWWLTYDSWALKGRVDLLLAMSSLHKFELPELGHFALEVVRHEVELGVGDADSSTPLPTLSTPKR